MTLREWKNRIALRTYGAEWGELTLTQKLRLLQEHKEQFNELHNKGLRSPKREKKMDNRNDHDILICLEVKLGELKKDFENHLKHHAVYTYLAFSTVIGMLVTLIVMLLK